jgi:hypothetical protein
LDKIIGFSLSTETPPLPPWLLDYPWLASTECSMNGWFIKLWGHGDLSKFIQGDRITIGYSGTDMEMLPPLHCRSLVLNLGQTATIANDPLGQMQVFYGAKDGRPFISTGEECVLRGIGGGTIGRGRLASWLMFLAGMGSLTLWDEIDQLPGNSVLTVGKDGSFLVRPQAPLEFYPNVNPRNIVPEARWRLEAMARRHTNCIGECHIAMTSGYDSRLIMILMNDPGRINAWTLPISSPPETNAEYAWAKQSAWHLGIRHSMVKLNLAEHIRPYVEWNGTRSVAMGGLYFGLIAEINRGERLPLINGVPGDTLAGSRVAETGAAVGLKEPADQFLALCQDPSGMWGETDLDDLLDYDWRQEMDEARQAWAEAMTTAEGPNFVVRADVARLRNRIARLEHLMTICADLWGGEVSPYCDKDWARWALSMPPEWRLDRKAIIDMACTYWPHIFGRPSDLGTYSGENTIDLDLASEQTMWPLLPEGSNFGHDLLRPEAIRAICRGAAALDMKAIRKAWALQPLAWAIRKGYVR